MNTEKQALRRELLALRNAIPLEAKQRWDAAINRAITEHPWFRQAESLLAYYPIGSEPDIRPALERALRQGKQIYLPRCSPETRQMTFYPVQSMETLKPGAHGIPEPEASNQLCVVNCELCLVPGIAFDQAGFRLGYGGGYYDRFLAGHGGLKTIGICYELLLRASLPKDAFDIVVERVITTRGDTYERE